jgi:hypothetical protein
LYFLRMISTNARFSNSLIFIFTASVLSLLLSCAHQVSPGGGPEDKTGPTVLQTEPEYGAVMVNPKTGISITLSEWISRTAAPKSVSILPPIEGGVKVRANGRRLEIKPVTAMAESTTYHVVITSQLIDLHNNPLSSSFTLVFSTGPTLDSGSIAGCIVDPAGHVSLAVVGLYRKRDTLSDSALFAAPDYLTQTDSAAFFSFENVRSGPYRLVAFIDQNNNRRLNPGVEAAYAPLLQTVECKNTPDTILLYPVESDTTGPNIAAVTPISPAALLATLTKAADTAAGISACSWSLERSDKNGNTPAVSYTTWIGSDMRRCVLHLADSQELTPYRLIFTYTRLSEKVPVTVCDTMRFNGARPVDTIPPALSSVTPVGTVGLEPELRFIFTEPITVTAPLRLTDSLGDTVALVVDSSLCDTVSAKPGRTLHAGSQYRLVVLSSAGKDFAGNLLKPRDTTDTVLTPMFTVIDADSLAVTFAGCVPCITPDSLRLWRFQPLNGGPSSYAADSSGCFSFDSIPGGKGLLMCWWDGNRNGKIDKGMLVPWRPPEPFSVFADTVEARARWEVEGVELKSACRRCEKHVPAKQDTTAATAKRALPD